MRGRLQTPSFASVATLGMSSSLGQVSQEKRAQATGCDVSESYRDTSRLWFRAPAFAVLS